MIELTVGQVLAVVGFTIVACILGLPFVKRLMG